jgi:hypothetical protein
VSRSPSALSRIAGSGFICAFAFRSRWATRINAARNDACDSDASIGLVRRWSRGSPGSPSERLLTLHTTRRVLGPSTHPPGPDGCRTSRRKVTIHELCRRRTAERTLSSAGAMSMRSWAPNRRGSRSENGNRLGVRSAGDATCALDLANQPEP